MSKRSVRRTRHLQASQEAPSRYERSGLLAIDPQAFLMFFQPPEVDETNETIGDVEIVDVCGPLDQHASRWCDSYEAIRERVQVACEGPARAIVLRVDSPGGEAAGCFEAARAIRAMCQAAGKPLHAYVDGKACSAAYALACAAESVSVGDTATVGSIGVINTRPDYSRQNAERGVQYAIVASGARKTDGHPDFPITEAELAETKLLVDSLAGVFFALVAEMRSTTPEAIAQLQARVYHGQGAVASGLVDFVQPFDQLLANIASPGAQTMATAYEKAKAALEEAAKIDDANGRAAKKALAAMGDDTAPGDEPAAPAKKPEEGAAAPAAAPPAAAAASAPAPAASVSAPTAAALATQVGSLAAEVADLRAGRESEARATLLASRPDVSESVRKVLADKPLADVKAMLAAIPVSVPNPAAAAAATGTRGEGQGSPTAARLEPAAKASLDAQMGLTSTTLGVREDGHRLVLGAVMPAATASAAAPATPTPTTPPAPPAAR